MPKPRPPHKPTVDHVGPQVPSDAGERAAMLATFPRTALLELPYAGRPVGRDWLAGAGIEDGEVSGEHIRFGRAGATWTVEDVGSRNGAWLWGHRLAPGEPVELRSGAVLRMGRSLLVFRAALSGPRRPAPSLGELVAPFGLRRFSAALEALARNPPSNVLIEGETGTGKELAARAVAAALGRANPFAPVNVAGVSAGVFESQLFGHVAGAFSGARQATDGVVLAHEGGTVLLDEIGELPLELQPKLLRLLENREVLQVGASRPVRADVLIVAATNQDLELRVEQGSFRRDLLARLCMARLHLPPLRQRAEDIGAIARAVASRVGLELDPEHTEVEAVERLLLEPWPSNVRGLIGALSQMAALEPGPGLRLWAVESVLGPRQGTQDVPLTRDVVLGAMERTGGNQSETARRLGITRGKLRRLLDKHGIK
ncbi:MAG: sigma 54-interacting transcriptional regulator [Deltaproteobacteria bacterium]|jgi:transcriptional regulator of acetoin/glycerol metabolism|nr:sigma 54-interacting transcriptional regulator [Deltaproteobacteria bacterium]MBW2537375.1 sigma 54-interacting transcriptional regulator [Deltaproteobacteria bacterium]